MRGWQVTRRDVTRAVIALAAVLVVACQGQSSSEPPIIPIRNMHDNPRYDPQERSGFFQDGRTMRPEVAHTVAVEAVDDPVLDTGVEDGPEGTAYVLTIPTAAVDHHGGMEGTLRRGQDRYGIYCVPCHGGVGDGSGLVPEVSGVATIRPPTFHSPTLRTAPDGQIYATIRNGKANMPAYRANIPVMDRWAIVAYVRALQLSQVGRETASNDAVPPAARRAVR